MPKSANGLSARSRIAMMQAAALALLGMSGLPAQAQFRDVVVFADQGLKAPLADADNLFLFENGSGVVVTYGDSAALAKQIGNGAAADVFIADNSDSMDELEKQKLIVPDTRANFLANKLVLIAPADSKATLTIGQNFPLAQALGGGRLAMADPAAIPAGRYSKAALESLGVWASVADKIAPAPDVRAVLLSVARGEAPLGVAYQSDAAADKSVKIVAAFPDTIHPAIVYPMAVLTQSSNIVAPVYVQYLRSPKAARFFEKQGFMILD